MSQRRVKVLQLQVEYGASTSDLPEQIVQALPADRYQVTNLFLKGGNESGLPPSKAERSIWFGFGKRGISGLRLRALWRLYLHCRSEGYDAVIAHRFKPINMLMLLNRWLRIPACIGVFHGCGELDRAYRRWEFRRLLTPAWRIVGVSAAVCDDLLAASAGLTASTVRRIDNAIDIAKAEQCQHPRAKARELLGLPADAFVFGAIGRLVPVKGHIYLLRAFAALGPSPDVLLAIIGEGRCRGALEAEITNLGIQKQVLLLGGKPEALQYVRAFDAFVMPSLSEGLPLALLEALSGRLPVIGSDIDSLKPILQACGGRMCRPAEAEGLAAAMRAVLDLSEAERQTEGERAYAYLCRTHSIEAFRRHYQELLSDMLGEGNKV